MRGKLCINTSVPHADAGDTYFSALVAAGTPLLTVDGRPVESFAQALQRVGSRKAIVSPYPMSEGEGMNVRLDSEAAELVRRYIATSPFNYSADDIASGSVVSLLTMAFDNQEEAARLTGLGHGGTRVLPCPESARRESDRRS